jgi:hypothetical protein
MQPRLVLGPCLELEMLGCVSHRPEMLEGVLFAGDAAETRIMSGT